MQFLHLLTQFFDLFAHLRQTSDVSVHSLVIRQRLNWNSPPYSRPHDLAGKNAGLRTNNRSLLHPSVIAKANLSTNHRVVFNHHTDGDARLSSDHQALSNVAVVTYVNHVVQFGAAADASATESRAIHAGIGSELDIVFNDHGADLRKLVVAHVISHIAKTIGSNTNANVENHAVAERDSVIQNYVGMENTFVSHRDIRTNYRTCFDSCVGADTRVFSNTNLRTNKCCQGDVSGFCNYGGGMNRWLATNRRVKYFCDKSECEFRV